MSDPLYKKELLRLAADATGAGRLTVPCGSATVHNPACGDKITIDVAVVDERIAAIAHLTTACVLTQASAAILGAHAPGLDRARAAALAEAVKAMLLGGKPPKTPFDLYGVFDGVATHAGRHRCVLLPLEAALEALELAKPGA